MGQESAIRKIGTPENVSDIGHFLRMYNQLSKFVPNLTETKPLKDLICKDCPWTWEHTQQDVLEKLKTSLSSTPVLKLNDPNARTRCFQSWTWSCATPSEWRCKTSFLYFKIAFSDRGMVCTDRQRSTSFHLRLWTLSRLSGWPNYIQYWKGPQTTDFFA